MLQVVEYADVYEKKSSYVFVDVRSPSEFSNATIPGAVNIPLFSDSEKSEIGIMYKQSGKSAAIELGLGFIGIKLPHIYNEFLSIMEEKKKILIFCARGGMRSGTIANLLKSFGMPVFKLKGGYKSYRSFIVESLPKSIEKSEFVVLYGKTGTGKTYILQELSNMGCNILDLEACANHRGSLLGGIGLGNTHSQKYFESLVFDSLERASESKLNIIFTEGESKRIGNIIMSNSLYDAVLNGRKILINSPLDKRVQNIEKEYLQGEYNEEEIMNAVCSLEKYIGKSRTEGYIEQIKRRNFKELIESLIVTYYDSAYVTRTKEFEKEFTNLDERATAKEIFKYILN